MNQIEPLDKTNFLIVFGPLFGLNLVTVSRALSRSVCYVQSSNLLCPQLIFPVDST